MDAWLGSHFFNPAFVAGGMALLAAPVIIHLINRMRYRTVRFAAMEFLLQSEQRNRRRLLLEQLLLLLLRILIVMAIVMLIARLILDPGQLSLFRGTKSHHVVLLDDSLSMRERRGETTAFAEALKIINELASEGAQRPDTQRFSLLLLSRPDQPFFSERDVNEALVAELATKLDPQTFPCTHRELSLLEGLQAAGRFLAQEQATVQHLHVVSDFREQDWKDQKALSAAVGDITAKDVTVNLVKTVGESQNNLSVTDLTGAVQVAAAGVPLRLKVKLRNQGDQLVRDVRAAVFDDGVKIPINIVFDKIEPRSEVEHEFDVRLASASRHRLRVALDPDVLPEDNARYLAVDVSESLPVLIVDGSPTGEGAAYIADALASDPTSTGISTTIENPDGLRRRPLENFRAIYLVNVPELAADAADLLDRYVTAGGGLVWFTGDAVRPAYYSSELYRDGEGLFPVRLGTAPRDLEADLTTSEPDLAVIDHPIFQVLTGDDNPFLQSVGIKKFFPVADDWVRDDVLRKDHVTTLARLRTGEPVIFEQQHGRGKVVACLTTAQPDWNDWAVNPSYVVFQLDLLKYVAKSDRGLGQQAVGEPIQIKLDPAKYLEAVEILAPLADGQSTIRLQAAPEENKDSGSSGGVQLSTVFRDTDEPGIYTVRLLNQSQVSEDRLMTFNVSPREGDLTLATTANLRKRLGDNPAVQIQEPGRLDWVQGEEAGSEIRRGLLWLLLVLLIAEQLMAYRLSFHPPLASATA